MVSDDEILKSFQAGNVNFTSKGTLIPGAQSLFGIKTQLQFGKLFVTTVLGKSKSTTSVTRPCREEQLRRIFL